MEEFEEYFIVVLFSLQGFFAIRAYYGIHVLLKGGKIGYKPWLCFNILSSSSRRSFLSLIENIFCPFFQQLGGR